MKGCFYFLQGGNQGAERKKKNCTHQTNIHLEHTLNLDREEAKTNLTPSWKPPYDHRMVSHMMHEGHENVRASQFFLNNIYTKSITEQLPQKPRY